MTKVFLFDRDLTVDLNWEVEDLDWIPEGAEPVPIEWVIWLAHESEHHVWATGNQHLRNEAGIPGVEEARDQWERAFMHSIKNDYPSDGYHSYKPHRKNRWRMVKDIYDEVSDEEFEFIIVDDTLHYEVEREGFDLWYPWNFTASVREIGEPVEIPEELDVPGVPLNTSGLGYNYNEALSELYIEDIKS